MLGWKVKLEFDVAYLVEEKDQMALMKLHLLSRSCLLKLFDQKNGKTVPLRFMPDGSYHNSSIKKTKFSKMVPVTTFQEHPVYVITNDRKPSVVMPSFENKMR
jgi:hypothetical protein